MNHTAVSTSDDWGALSALPGNPLMWVLIGSELLVFGALLGGFAAVRVLDPAAFAADQARLDAIMGGLNTLVLVTSGLFAALAVRASHLGAAAAARGWLTGAMALGLVFLVVKVVEYAAKAEAGIGLETSAFFTLYYLTTGFHAAHVVMGLVLLTIALWRPAAGVTETVAAFWHMVDLVWVLIYPLVYLIQ